MPEWNDKLKTITCGNGKLVLNVFILQSLLTNDKFAGQAVVDFGRYPELKSGISAGEAVELDIPLRPMKVPIFR